MFFSFFSRFSYRVTLGGPSNAVWTLSFSFNSLYLAAGGCYGLSIYDLQTTKPMALPTQYFRVDSDRYRVSATQWIYFEDSDRHVLILGAVDGSLDALSLNHANSTFEPFGRAVDSTRREIRSIEVLEQKVERGGYVRIATAAGDGKVALWKLHPSGTFVKVFSVVPDNRPDNFPVSALFDEKRNLLVSFRFGGEVVLLQRKEGKISSKRKIGHDIGAACIDLQGKRIVMSTGRSFEVLSFPGYKKIRTLEESGPPFTLYPKQVQFLDDRETLVGGTDHSEAVIHNVATGKIIQRLKYPKGGLVTTVATGTNDEYGFVAYAGSTLDVPSEILIWQRTRKHSMWHLMKISMRYLSLRLHWVLFSLVLLTLAYFYPTVLNHAWSRLDGRHQLWDIDRSAPRPVSGDDMRIEQSELLYYHQFPNPSPTPTAPSTSPQPRNIWREEYIHEQDPSHRKEDYPPSATNQAHETRQVPLPTLSPAHRQDEAPLNQDPVYRGTSNSHSQRLIEQGTVDPRSEKRAPELNSFREGVEN